MTSPGSMRIFTVFDGEPHSGFSIHARIETDLRLE